MSRKSIVITGCSSGFGRLTALDLAGRGWRVFATVRKDADRENLLAEAAERGCQPNLTVVLCDITQPDQVEALAQEVIRTLRGDASASSEGEALPGLNALLNNAGTAYGGPLELLPLEDLSAQFKINVVAHLGIIQAFLPLLKVAKGTIINVSSVNGRFAAPVIGAYASSKFALEGLSDALRLELAPFGVHVVVIEPDSSPTNIWQTSIQRSAERLDPQRSGPYAHLLRVAEKVATRSRTRGFPMQMFADTVAHILESNHPHARYVVPRSAAVLVQARRFLPDSVWDYLVRRTIKW